MERKNIYLCMLAALLSCSDSVKMSWTAEHMPNIFPDYAGVVIPPNIAPLNFALKDSADETRVVFASGEQLFVVKGGKQGYSGDGPGKARRRMDGVCSIFNSGSS